MKLNTITVLLIEDNPGDAELLQELLAEVQQISFQVTWMDTLSTGLQYMADHKIDLLLLDLTLPDSEGLNTLVKAQTQAPYLPVVVLTGCDDEEQAVKAMREGAQDYLVKDQIDSHLLVRSIRYAIERKQAEETLRERNQFIESLLDNIPDMIFVKDAKELRFVRLNKAAEELIGYPRKEIIGKDDYDFFSKEYAESFVTIDRETLQNGDVLDIPAEPIQTLHKGVRILHTKRIPIPSGSGEPQYLLGISEDITEHKQAEARLRESEAKFRAIFEGSLDVILIIDSQTGEILRANPTTQRILGYEPASLIGQHLSSLLPPLPQLDGEDLLEKLHVYGPVFESQEFLRANKTLCPMDLTATIIPWGKTQAILATLRDVTERKWAEAKIIQRDRELLALQYAGAAMASSFDLAHLLQTVTQEVVNLLGVEACIVSEWDQEANSIFVVAQYGLAEWEKRHTSVRTSDLASNPAVAEVLRERHSLYSTCTQPNTDPVELAYMEKNNIKTLLMLPMEAQNRVVGLIEIEDTRQERTFTVSELRMTQLLANQTAIAIQNDRLQADLERYAQRLSILHELDRAISASLQLDDVYQAITQYAPQLLEYDRLSITLREGEEICVTYATVKDDEVQFSDVKPLSHTSAVDWCIRTGQSLLRNNLSSDIRFEWDEKLVAAGIQASMVIPLWVKGQVIGTWNIGSRKLKAFDSYDLQIGQSIADQIAIAIENARLFEQAQREISERRHIEADLRASEERFRQVASSISDHIYVTKVTKDGQNVNLYISPNVEDLTGYAVEKIKEAWDFWPSVMIHPEDRGIALRQAKHLTAGQNSVAEYRLIRADGKVIWVRDSGRVQHEGKSRIIYGVVGDITERKQRERELEAIATIATSLRAAMTRADMLPLILDPLLDLLQVKGAAIDIYVPSTGETVVELACGDWINIIGLRTPPGQGVSAYVLNSRQIYVSNNVYHDPRLYDPASVGALNAVACVPLVAQTQTIGVLWIGRKGEMTTDTVQLLSAISDIAANALQRAALFEQLQESNTELTRLTVGLESVVKERTADLLDAINETTQARDKIDAILNSVADGLVVTDLENKVILANPAAEELLGFKQEDMLGQEIGVGIKDDRLRTIVRGTLNKYINGYEIDIELEDPRDGQRKVMRARTSLVDDRQGQPLGTVTIIQDVTEIRQIDRMKTEFISTAAHEFRTPLTSIQGFSEILLTRQLELNRQERYLQMINQQSTHLAEIVDDLLNVARLEAGQGLNIKPEPINLNTLFQEVLMPFIETNSDHQIRIEGLETLPPVAGDPFRLAQVCKNLIANAIKYSPEGGTVTIAGHVIPDYVEVSIHDDGIGMTPEQQKHLFKKFYRADSSNTSISGTGLGLAICKLIVELHGGKIWVNSKYGQGTTVHFSLPRSGR